MKIVPKSIHQTKNKPAQTTKSEAQQKKDAKLKAACADFEALLIHSMLKSMRDTLPKDGLFKKSMQQDIYQSMLDQELSEKIAKSRNNFGIGDVLYRQLNGINNNMK